MGILPNYPSKQEVDFLMHAFLLLAVLQLRLISHSRTECNLPRLSQAVSKTAQTPTTVPLQPNLPPTLNLFIELKWRIMC